MPTPKPTPIHTPTLENAQQLFGEKRFEEAYQEYRLLNSTQGPAPDYINLSAMCLANMNEFEQAEKDIKFSLSLDPTYGPTWIVYGVILGALGKYKEAYRATQESVILGPGNPQANWNLALFGLHLELWEEAWRQYNWGRVNKMRDIRHPMYTPDLDYMLKTDTETVVIYSEQGIGDFFLFCRYVKALSLAIRQRSPNALVILEVEHPLVAWVYNRMDLLLVDGVYARNGSNLGYRSNPGDEFTYVLIPLFDTPYLLKESAPSREPYIPQSAPNIAIDQVLDGVFAKFNNKKPTVGVVWAGNRTLPNDCNRSVTIQVIKDIVAKLDINVLSLQYGESDELPKDWVSLEAEVPPNWDITSRAIARCDTIVTVDTAIANLSGGMGKHTLVLLPLAREWRWGWDRQTSPFFCDLIVPISQKIRKDWSSVIYTARKILGEKYGENNMASGKRSSGKAT